jgi:hypothetical protein
VGHVSLTVIKSIHCDGCGAFHYADLGEPVAHLRRDLRRLGWRVNVKREDGFVQDFCPTCVSRTAT